MKTTIITGLMIAALAIGCTSQNQPDQPSNNTHMEKEEKESIEALLSSYKKSLNTSDADLAVSLYAKDGVFMPSEAPSAIGSDNIKSAYQFVFSQIQLNIEFFIEEIVIEGDVAYSMTTSKGSTLIHATGNTVPEENRELFVFEKVSGEWKIARYMFNKMSAAAAPETN